MPDNRASYLAKLLTLLIRRSNGVIRIPAADLMSLDIGQGLQVHFDYDTKELVLTWVPAGSAIYKIEGNSQSWLNQELLNPPSPTPLQPLRPKSQDDLIARAWTESAATLTTAEERQPREPKNRVIHLTDETMAAAESERKKLEVLKELEDYQPSRRTEPIRSSSPDRVARFSKS